MEDAALSAFSVFFTQPASFLAYQRLIQSDQTLPNQLGKATQQPTLSWVFKEINYKMNYKKVVLNFLRTIRK
ncbi:MAG: hypothetical protein OHK0047_45220 [Leptolyngbyaceae cyanobacterium]